MRTPFRHLALIACLPACMELDEPTPEQPDEAPQVTMIEEAFPGRTGELRSARLQTNVGSQTLTYEVIDGLAVFEGDIILGRADEIETKSGTLYSTTRNLASFRWPSGIIPYEFSSSISSAKREMILDAINHWHQNTVFWFTERDGETDYVRFVEGTSGCSSSGIGRQTGMQTVTTYACETGNLIHELGHVVGLWHEHTRSDRSETIIVKKSNIIDAKEHNFETYEERNEDGRDLFAMDFGSIMMYGSFNNFAVDTDQPTMTRHDGSTWTSQRNALTANDIAGATRFLALDATESTFMLKNAGTAKCMDNTAGTQVNGTKVNQYTCDGANNGRWYLHHVPWASGEYIVINDRTGMCLDIAASSTQSGVHVQLWSCHGYDNQLFSFTGNNTTGYQFQANHSGKCLEVENASTTNSARVIQSSCDTGTNQKWRFTY